MPGMNAAKPQAHFMNLKYFLSYYHIIDIFLDILQNLELVSLI